MSMTLGSSFINFNLYSSLFCISLSTFISLFFNPILIKLGKKYNFFDSPSVREIKKNNNALVNIGGVSLFVGFFSVIFFIYLLFKSNFVGIYDDIFLTIPVISFACLIIFSTGFYDDKFPLSPFLRLVIQFSSASIMWVMGLRIEFLDLNFLIESYDLIELPRIISYFLTIIWIVGIINAINWLDGIDGLASGTSLLISLGMLIIGFYFQNSIAILFTSSIIGSCSGFLFYNLPPARIIMGDGGSNLLGFLLALTSIILFKENTNLAILPFSILIFLVPIFDMSKVILLRIKKGNSPFLPDKNHLHFQLLEKGFNEKEVLMIIFLLVCISLSVSLLFLDFKLFLPFLISSIVGILIIFLKKLF